MAKSKKPKSRKVKGKRMLGENNSNYRSNYNENNSDNTTDDMMAILNNDNNELNNNNRTHNNNSSHNNNSTYNDQNNNLMPQNHNTIAGLLGTPSGSNQYPSNMVDNGTQQHMINNIQQPMINNMRQPIINDMSNIMGTGMQQPMDNMSNMVDYGMQQHMMNNTPTPMMAAPHMSMGNRINDVNNVDPLHYQSLAPVPSHNNDNLNNLSALAREIQPLNKYNNKFDNMSELNIDVNELNSTQQSFNNMNLGNNVNNLNNLLSNTQGNQPSSQQVLTNLNNMAKLIGGKKLYNLTSK